MKRFAIHSRSSQALLTTVIAATMTKALHTYADYMAGFSDGNPRSETLRTCYATVSYDQTNLPESKS